MKKDVLIIISIILLLICSSGCVVNKVNNTWGEKKISMDTIKVQDDIIGYRSNLNESIYFVSGNITNQNSFDAIDPKIQIITYYSNGTVFAINNTPYLNPSNIPANAKSVFYARFEDPNKQIAKFEVKILSAKGQY